MLLTSWRFVTLTLASLLMGITFCHVLELPAKMTYPASLYLQLHRTLYVAFGPPNPGAFIEVGAILAALVLVFLVRKRQLVFWLSLLGALCLVAGIVVFFLLVEPANVALRNMPLEVAPADWTRWRDQWEYGHAAHFVCHLLAFSALALSVLVEAHSFRETAPLRTLSSPPVEEDRDVDQVSPRSRDSSVSLSQNERDSRTLPSKRSMFDSRAWR